MRKNIKAALLILFCAVSSLSATTCAASNPSTENTENSKKGEILAREIYALPDGDILITESQEMFRSSQGNSGKSEENSASLPMDNILSAEGRFTASGTSLSVTARATVWALSDIRLEIILQKKSNGSWITADTWNEIWHDAESVFLTKSYEAAEGETYRMQYSVTSQKDTKRGTTPALTVSGDASEISFSDPVTVIHQAELPLSPGFHVAGQTDAMPTDPE